MDIRRETRLIIRKDGQYLVGRILYSEQLRWSTSAWEAWRTKIRAEARSVAEKVDEEIMLFNPVAGQMRKARI